MLAVTSTRTETHEPIRVGYDCDGSQIIYREIDNLRAMAVSKGDCDILAEFGDITINGRIIPVYRLTVDSKCGQWESTENLTRIFTRLYQ